MIGPDESGAALEVPGSSEGGGSADPPLDSGRCPICDEEFLDRSRFREHLGEAHELYDDDGAETDFVAPLLAPIEVRSVLALPATAAVEAAAPPDSPTALPLPLPAP